MTEAESSIRERTTEIIEAANDLDDPMTTDRVQSLAREIEHAMDGPAAANDSLHPDGPR